MSPATKSRRPPPRREDRRPDEWYATSDIGRNERVSVLLMAIKGDGSSQVGCRGNDGAFG
eukprot:scaffold1647_cov148-Skeletonema_menzelii.AAC.2